MNLIWVWQKLCLSGQSFLNGPFPASFFFIIVFSTQLTVNNDQYKYWQWLVSNRGPLVSEATVLPTVSQPQFLALNLFKKMSSPMKPKSLDIFLLEQNVESVFKWQRVEIPSKDISAKWERGPVWPDKNRQMSIKVAQKWFHKKNEWFWHLYKNCLRMWKIWAN